MIIDPNNEEGPLVIYLKDTNMPHILSTARKLCDFLKYSEITKNEILEDIACADFNHAILVLEHHFSDYVALIGS